MTFPVNSRRRALLALSGAALLAPATAGAANAALEVKGLVERPLALALDDMRAMPQQALTARRSKGGESKVSGVLLRDVLDRAGLVERHPKDLRKTVIVAGARDGYAALFTWVELYLFSTGRGVLVVLERDGAPLSPAEGPLALVSALDERAGPRHVKWLRSVEARLVEPGA